MKEISIINLDLSNIDEKVYHDINEAFINGEGIIFNFIDEDIKLKIYEAIILSKKQLNKLKLENGFFGADNVRSTRKSFCCIYGLNHHKFDISYLSKQLIYTDANKKSVEDGLKLLVNNSLLRESLDQLSYITNRMIKIVLKSIEKYSLLNCEEFEKAISGANYRLRAILYDANDPDSRCGLHPDGNMFSVLYTDGTGLKCFDRGLKKVSPNYAGIIILPGTLLDRWSNNYYKPTFHYVNKMTTESKTSLVYFFNLQNHKVVNSLTIRSKKFVNSIQIYKIEDLDINGRYQATYSKIINDPDYQNFNI